jgi:signal transduction histidine kinase/CheY-like chemotaxis protein
MSSGWLGTLRGQSRLLAAVMAILSLTVALLALRHQRETERLTAALTASADAALDAVRAGDSAAHLRQEVRTALLLQDADAARHYSVASEALAAHLGALYGRLPPERAAALQQAAEAYTGACEAQVAEIREGHLLKATRLDVEIDEAYDALSTQLGTLELAPVRAGTAALIAEARGASGWISYLLLVIASLSAIVAALAGAALRPLDRILEVLDGTRSGDLTRRVAQRYPGELGTIAEALDQALERLQQAVQARHDAEFAREVAEQASALKGRFLATMSHELRTPMNGVIGTTALLRETPLDSEQRELTELIQTSGEVLLGLINDILDHSQLEADCLQLEAIAFSPEALLEETLALLAPRALEREIQLLLEPDGSLPEEVIGDPTRLRQVLINLVNNAIKFTHEGGVTVRAYATPRGGGVALTVEVVDTGIGVAPAQQERLFQPFIQADSSTTRKYGGTGLGLTICRQLVQLMGGSIDLESAPGEGTTFRFTVQLGVSDARSEALSPAPDAPRALVVAGEDLRGRFVHCVGRWGLRAEVSALDAALVTLQQAASQGAPFSALLLDARGRAPQAQALIDSIRGQSALAAPRLVALCDPPFLGEPVEGADGVVTRPLRQGKLQALLCPSSPAAPAARRAAPSRAHLLIAEDNPVNQRVISYILDKLGYRYTLAGDGAQAVEAFSQGSFDLVMMDCQMPEVDGYEATRRIRALPGGGALPIVAMTAHAFKEDRDRCLDAGMSDYLTKPVTLEQLAEMLERWLDTPGARAAG